MTETPTRTQGGERPDPAGTVVVLATAWPSPGRREAVLDIIRGNVPTVHEEEGCLTYAVHTADDPERVVFVERWTSQEALAAHAASPHMARTNEALAPLVERPTEVFTATSVPMGTPTQGTF